MIYYYGYFGGYEFGVLHNTEHMRFQAFNLSLYAHVLSVGRAFF